MWDRSKLFLRRAGTVILAISILLWFLATYPRDTASQEGFEARRAQLEQRASVAGGDQDASRLALEALAHEEAGERLRGSFAGMLGRAVEPLIAPLGFDWKIGIGIIASFAAREVFVSTMSTVYNVGSGDDEGVQTLAETLKRQKRADGKPVYTPLVGITLMVFYVFALQCVSTVAVVRRETNGWRWAVFQWVYMGILAWGLAFLTKQVGQALGY
jgi:ferrous iron transport protein B